MATVPMRTVVMPVPARRRVLLGMGDHSLVVLGGDIRRRCDPLLVPSRRRLLRGVKMLLLLRLRRLQLQVVLWRLHRRLRWLRHGTPCTLGHAINLAVCWAPVGVHRGPPRV